MKILLFFYNILLIFLMPFVALFGYFIMKRKNKAGYYLERFGFIKVKDFNPEKSIWFHCASVGETRSIKPIVEYIRENYKDFSIIVSTMTATGRNEALNFIGADKAFLLPIENPPAVSNIIKTMNVKLMVIVDTELWPDLIYTASSIINVFLINARISDKTFKTYKRFSFIFKPLLKRFSCIMTKSQLDTDRFYEILKSDKNLITAGNIKFQARKNKEDVSLIEEFKDKRFFLMASTHAEEESEILSWFSSSMLQFDKIVIAPRHIERCEEILSIAEKAGYSSGLYSKNQFDKDVIIIDAFGKLEGLYILADKIFIGGSIKKIGGHNIYEALQFKKEVAVGPNMFSFAEIYNIAKKHKIVYEISSREDAISWLQCKNEDKEQNFKDFFEEIDKSNNKTIETITDILSAVMNISEKK